MKKLFLTSFTFKTGEREHQDYRIVMVTKKDHEILNRYEHDHIDKDLYIADRKTELWFNINYPESTLLWLATKPVIEFYHQNDRDGSYGDESKYGSVYNGTGGTEINTKNLDVNKIKQIIDDNTFVKDGLITVDIAIKCMKLYAEQQGQ
jgi:hypothetical protein